MLTKRKIYFILFTSMLYLSAFTFGGGYVIVPLMKKKFVDDLKWIDEDEMLNLIAIGQSSPGAIAVNTAILLGYRVGGIRGALLSILGTSLPPLVIITIISLFYVEFKSNIIIALLLKGMQAAVTAVIIDVVINLAIGIIRDKKAIQLIIMISAFIATYVFKINVAYIILTCIFIGLIYSKRKKYPLGEKQI